MSDASDWRAIADELAAALRESDPWSSEDYQRNQAALTRYEEARTRWEDDR